MGQAQSENMDRENKFGNSTDFEEMDNHRSELQVVISVFGNAEPLLMKFLEFNCCVSKKCKMLPVAWLLRENSKTTRQLKQLSTALNILEKYGRHLMKSEDGRSSLWRCILFSNRIYSEKVAVIKGGKNIVKALGYSQEIEGGLEFPQEGKPDRQKILCLVCDILIIKQEIDAYLNDQHPHRELFEKLLSRKFSPSEQIKDQQHSQPTAKSVNGTPYPGMTHDEVSSPNHQNSSSSELMEAAEFKSHTCSICGSDIPTIQCSECERKILCNPCDKLWHKHRNRVTHKRWDIQTQSFISSSPPNVISPVYEPDIHIGRQDSQYYLHTTSLLDNGGDDLRFSRYNFPSGQQNYLFSQQGYHPTDQLTFRSSSPDLSRLNGRQVPYQTQLSEPVNRAMLNMEPRSQLQNYNGPRMSGMAVRQQLPVKHRGQMKYNNELLQMKDSVAVLDQQIQQLLQNDPEYAELKAQRRMQENPDLHAFGDNKQMRGANGMSFHNYGNGNDHFMMTGSHMNTNPLPCPSSCHPNQNGLYRMQGISQGQSHNGNYCNSDLVTYHNWAQLVRMPVVMPGDTGMYANPYCYPASAYAAANHFQRPPSHTSLVCGNHPPSDMAFNELSQPPISNLPASSSNHPPFLLDYRQPPKPKDMTIIHPPDFGQYRLALQQGFDAENTELVQHLPGLTPMGQDKNLHLSKGRKKWKCQHCTYDNEPSSNICAICNKTTDKPEFVYEQSEFPGTAEDDDKSIDEAARKIAEEHDKVYLEKVEAHKKYKEKHKMASFEPTEPELVCSLKKNSASIVAVSPPSGGCDLRTKMPFSDPTDSGHMIQGLTSAGNSEPLSRNSNSAVLDKTNVRAYLDFVNEQRFMTQLQLEGSELVNLLRQADRLGHDAVNVQIAQELSPECKLKPLDWLKVMWPEYINSVVAMTAADKTVGQISKEEATKALKKHGGNVKAASEHSIKLRNDCIIEMKQMQLFSDDEILNALNAKKGNLQAALKDLLDHRLNMYTSRIWATSSSSHIKPMDSYGTHQLCISKQVEDKMKDTSLEKLQRIRLIFAENKLQSWGRAEIVLDIIDKDLVNLENVTVPDVVEAVYNCGSRMSSLIYLQTECITCYSNFPMSKIHSLGTCECKFCICCFKTNFECKIKENHVRNWTCPICSLPHLDNEQEASNYFSFLSMKLPTILSAELIELYETKVRDWLLQKDPNFRWCAHCGNGFLYQAVGQKMKCPTCKKHTCFDCKTQWESQHEGITCEEFKQWKIDNDPETQACGLARYLGENGIECPSCKMRYSLTKGGCMHFRCPECGHEFCSGCYFPFFKKGQCNKYKRCEKLGLHCHHPRDCFFYLRDFETKELQTLLHNGDVQFNTEPSNGQSNQDQCPVMLQKESGRNDEECGEPIEEQCAGLCLKHYKEYLVLLINKFKIDPISQMSTHQMEQALHRIEVKPPKIKENESDVNFDKRLRKLVKEKDPLKK